MPQSPRLRVDYKQIVKMEKINTVKELFEHPDGTYVQFGLQGEKIDSRLEAFGTQHKVCIVRIETDSDGNKTLKTVAILEPQRSDVDPNISDAEFMRKYGMDYAPMNSPEFRDKEIELLPLRSAWELDQPEDFESLLMEIV